MITLNINGKSTSVDSAPDTPLLWVLRNDLGLTGTKFGCGMALCGACTVHIDGQPARACVTPIDTLAGKRITTIEGALDASADPRMRSIGQAVRNAWVELDVAQCGYCQPGQVMAAVGLLSVTANPNDYEINEAMSGNLCRCGTYPRIRAAVQLAAKKLA